MLLNRPSKNAPRVWSCWFASRASGSFRHFMNQLRLCSRCRARVIQAAFKQMPLHPLVRHRQRPPHLVPRRKQPPPPPHHVFVRPAPGDVGVEPHQHMEVIIHHREPADRHRKDFRKFLQPALDPYLAVVPSPHPARTRGGHTASRSGTSGRRQDRPDARGRSSWGFSGDDPLKLPRTTPGVKLTMHVLFVHILNIYII